MAWMRGLVFCVGGVVFGFCLMQIETPTAAQAKRTAASVVADVSKTIGAANLKSIQYSGIGFQTNNSCRPGGPWPKLKLDTYTRVLDYEKVTSREEVLQSQGGPVCGAGFQPIMGQLRVWEALNGDFAWSYGGAGADNPPVDGAPSPGAVEGRKFDMALTPHGWAKAAMTAANPTMETKTVDGKQLTAVTFMWNGMRKITGYVDAQNLLTRVDNWENSDIVGDVTTTISYSQYKDFSGIKFPMKILETQSGDPYSLRPVLDLTVTSVQPNAAVRVDVPDSIKRAAPGGGGGRAQSQQLADGVWAIYAGGTQSEAIDFRDYSVVVEASGNEARSLAVIAETKRLIPNKPIRYIVNSHHHLDHSGGLRTFVAEGATIITNEINKPYWEALFKNPHTLKPDKLAQNPKPAVFITVKDKYVLTDGNRSLELHLETDQMHDQGLLMVYLPKEKVLFPSDAFMLNHWRPGTPGSRSTVGMGDNLLANIARLKLDVQQVVPVHTDAGTFAVPFAEAKKRIAERHGDGN